MSDQTIPRTGILWVADAKDFRRHGRVSGAVFVCKENISDIIRAEITCEDADQVYSFTLAPTELGYAGECSIWSADTHQLRGKQQVQCAIVNGTDGGALLLSGLPMKAYGRNDLYWMIRIEKVTREFKRS